MSDEAPKPPPLSFFGVPLRPRDERRLREIGGAARALLDRTLDAKDAIESLATTLRAGDTDDEKRVDVLCSHGVSLSAPCGPCKRRPVPSWRRKPAK